MRKIDFILISFLFIYSSAPVYSSDNNLNVTSISAREIFITDASGNKRIVLKVDEENKAVLALVSEDKTSMILVEDANFSAMNFDTNMTTLIQPEALGVAKDQRKATMITHNGIAISNERGKSKIIMGGTDSLKETGLFFYNDAGEVIYNIAPEGR